MWHTPLSKSIRADQGIVLWPWSCAATTQSQVWPVQDDVLKIRIAKSPDSAVPENVRAKPDERDAVSDVGETAVIAVAEVAACIVGLSLGGPGCVDGPSLGTGAGGIFLGCKWDILWDSDL